MNDSTVNDAQVSTIDSAIATASEFLTLMAEDQPVLIQALYEYPGQNRRPVSVSGQPDDLLNQAFKLNSQGFGLFWTVNATDETGQRKAENVVAIRALFIDLDGATLEPVREACAAANCEPHAIVESSPGRWHVYWSVADCTLGRFASLQKALAKKFGGDKTVCDLPRLMRLPGSLHWKTGRALQSKVISREAMMPYQVDDLSARLGLSVEGNAQHAAADTNPASHRQHGESPAQAEVRARYSERGSKLPDGSGRYSYVTGHAGWLLRSYPTMDGDDIWKSCEQLASTFFTDDWNWAAARDCVHALTLKEIDKRAQRESQVSNLIDKSSQSSSGEMDIDGPPGSHDLMATEFAYEYSSRLRYTEGIGWQALSELGNHWTDDGRLTRFDAARRIARGAAMQTKDAGVARSITSANTINGIVTLARSDSRINVPIELWDANDNLFNTAGGVVDLQTGRFLTNSTGLFFRKYTKVAPTLDATAAPTFHQFLNDVFEYDPEIIEYVQRWCGYCLTGDRREHIMLFAYGTGANGKSVFFDLLRDVAGSYAGGLRAEALMRLSTPQHPADLAMLHGKRIAFTNELDEGLHFDESRIKQLTGDETLTARRMRQDPYDFRMTQKHILIGNHKPRFNGGDYAMARRMKLLAFNARFDGAKRDPMMGTRLRGEAPAILGWMIEGARKWYQSGLRIPHSVEKASAKYLDEQDDISTWIAESALLEPNQRTSAGALYEHFKLWKFDRGERAPSIRTWGERMSTRDDIDKARISGTFFYRGIGLSADALHRLNRPVGVSKAIHGSY